MRILIVEDEPKAGDYLLKGLTESGFVVDLARDGVDGLAHAREHPYDLIVLDVMLPNLDGWQVLRELRRERDTPVLLDAFVLRPVGLALTAVGTVLFLPAAAVVGCTRPTDIGKPFQMLIANPFRYTFIDPLGQH